MSKQSPGESLTNNDKIYLHENRKQTEDGIVQEDKITSSPFSAPDPQKQVNGRMDTSNLLNRLIHRTA